MAELQYNDLRDLAVKVATGAIPTTYSAEQLEESLRTQLRTLAPKGDYYAYQMNKPTIFRLITEVVDLVLPNSVLKAIGQFAEVRQYAQGEKAVFTRKLGKTRGKNFVTRVGLAGVYESFTLDSTTFDVETFAMGGAVTMELERFLDGHISFNDLLDVVNLGFEEALYQEVQKALRNTYNATGRPTVNNVSGSTFDVAKMQKLLSVVRAYGNNATIFCSSLFAATMTPAQGWSARSDADASDMRDQGYIGRFSGAPVVLLPTSFIDETNTTFTLDPAVAYVIPTGGTADEKIVKVAFEGQAIVRQQENADWSMELQTYKKMGVAVLHTNYFGIYENTSIDRTGFDALAG